MGTAYIELHGIAGLGMGSRPQHAERVTVIIIIIIISLFWKHRTRQSENTEKQYEQ